MEVEGESGLKDSHLPYLARWLGVTRRHRVVVCGIRLDLWHVVPRAGVCCRTGGVETGRQCGFREEKMVEWCGGSLAGEFVQFGRKFCAATEPMMSLRPRDHA